MKEDTKKTVAFRDLGSMDYQEAWTYQENLFADIVANGDMSPDMSATCATKPENTLSHGI